LQVQHTAFAFDWDQAIAFDPETAISFAKVESDPQISSDFFRASLESDWVRWGRQNSRRPAEGMVFTNRNLHAGHIDLSNDHVGELLGTHALLEHWQTPKRELPPINLGPKALNDLSRNMVDGESCSRATTPILIALGFSSAGMASTRGSTRTLFACAVGIREQVKSRASLHEPYSMQGHRWVSDNRGGLVSGSFVLVF
jgi:hypothetical protein